MNETTGISSAEFASEGRWRGLHRAENGETDSIALQENLRKLNVKLSEPYADHRHVLVLRLSLICSRQLFHATVEPRNECLMAREGTEKEGGTREGGVFFVGNPAYRAHRIVAVVVVRFYLRHTIPYHVTVACIMQTVRWSVACFFCARSLASVNF